MARDLWRFLAVAVTAALVGLILDALFASLWIATLGYLAWQYRELLRLAQWVRHRKRHPAPDHPGVFEDLCRAVDLYRDRDKTRKTKLQDYLKQVRQATAALSEAAVVIGQQGEIEWANPAARDLLGVRWPQDARQRVTNLLRDPRLVQLFKTTCEGETVRSVEMESHTRPDCMLSVSIVGFGAGQHLLTARDVTRLHRINEMRRDFVTNVSHELRTPLTVVRGYVEGLLADRQRDPAQWQQALAALEAHTLRMQRIVEDLLFLARLDQDERPLSSEPVSVPALVTEVHEEAQSIEGDAHHRFVLEVDTTLWVMGDRAELRSCLSNLVGNAVHYTAAGGVIKIHWWQDAAAAHLEVKDTGIGIPAHHIPRLTERFYRVDPGRSRASGGTGLGLAIVKHVLKRHGATLHIESIVERGSSFRCDFPAELILPAAERSRERNQS